jgi:hypothetical protein
MPPQLPAQQVFRQFQQKIMGDGRVVLIQTFESIRYAFLFCSLASAQLKSMFESYIHDLDLRWNQYFTVRICQIFVQYCKTVLFIYTHRALAKFVVGLASIIQDRCFQQYRANDELRDILLFVCQVGQKPFQFIGERLRGPDTAPKSNVLDAMAGFLSGIGSFIARLFGQYPLIEWDDFSMYSRTGTLTSMLMPDEFLILAHLSLLKEATLFFIVMEFRPNCGGPVSENFTMITTSVIGEATHIALSRTVRMSVSELLQLSHSSEIRGDANQVTHSACRAKFRSSHRWVCASGR